MGWGNEHAAEEGVAAASGALKPQVGDFSGGGVELLRVFHIVAATMSTFQPSVHFSTVDHTANPFA